MKTAKEILKECIEKYDSAGYCYCEFDDSNNPEGIEVSNTDAVIRAMEQYAAQEVAKKVPKDPKNIKPIGFLD